MFFFNKTYTELDPGLLHFVFQKRYGEFLGLVSKLQQCFNRTFFAKCRKFQHCNKFFKISKFPISSKFQNSRFLQNFKIPDFFKISKFICCFGNVMTFCKLLYQSKSTLVQLFFLKKIKKKMLHGFYKKFLSSEKFKKQKFQL